MPIYLIAAYVVFLLLPIGLAASILIRKRQVQHKINTLQAQTSGQISPQ